MKSGLGFDDLGFGFTIGSEENSVAEPKLCNGCIEGYPTEKIRRPVQGRSICPLRSLLSFFREYVQILGGKIPNSANEAGSYKASHAMDERDEDMEDLEEIHPKHEEEEEEEEEEPDIIESDIELDEPDNEPPQKMGKPSIEVSEENCDASQEARIQAMEAISEGKYDEAIEHLTKAILLNPTSVIMYATRATVYIKMKKPNAAVRDANAALEINRDSAEGCKSRGMGRAMLGQWEEAIKDLHLASKLDYDEEINAVLKKSVVDVTNSWQYVEPNAHKIEEHCRIYDRLHKESEDHKIELERRRRRAEAQAAYEKAKKQEQSSSIRPGGMPGGMPGGFPGGMPRGFPGSMPGGMPGTVDYSKILNVSMFPISLC
ncbi:unnamed protein product [Fraxinus pennsylvanica]|uniref:Uncharacterized protein n=1 Tax=Fraxinus pennsylvanica TaxID=56036 RepID=A0AAD2ABT5_9LAMI|nr:unnamed protein product [Fraxinus pennsylvanica]